MIVYSAAYELDLGGHIWPTAKYRLTAEALLAAGTVSPEDVVPPEVCSWDDLALVHTPSYLHRVRTGGLSESEIGTLELPWIPELVDGFRLMTGGTCLAARLSLDRGHSVHLGGGLHHAFPDHGEGFCLFNDVAVAVRRLQRDRRIRRAAIIDADVHHGNGTAMVFSGDESVFTFSIHQQHNYPFWKPRSDLDIGLPDGTSDGPYLSALQRGVSAALQSMPDLVVYLAGADPFREDRLGGLSLTHEGLLERDRLVFRAAATRGVPVVVVLAGGYALRVEDTVAVHVNTVRALMGGPSA